MILLNGVFTPGCDQSVKLLLSLHYMLVDVPCLASRAHANCHYIIENIILVKILLGFNNYLAISC